jgi:hypothetical protein
LSGVKRALNQRLSITLNVVGVSFTTFAGTVPVSGLDPYTDSALLNPWPVSRQMREAGPAVWLPEYGLLALTRYDSMRRALGLGDVLLLRHGVMMNDEMSQVLRGNTLCTNPADHDVLRRVAIKPLRPRELAELTDDREPGRLIDRKTEINSTRDTVAAVSRLLQRPISGRSSYLYFSVGSRDRG